MTLHRTATRAEQLALALLYTFTVLAVAGYGWFGLDPARLPSDGFAPRLYNVSFQFFAQAHILLALVVLALVLVGRVGVRALPPVLAVCCVSFLSEHVGTGYGIPFGGYEYTGLLGRRIGPRVPALIPVSWFLMALPAWVMARHLMGTGSGRGARIVVGAAWLVAWDLALDPAMSFLTPYWRWAEAGPYYGMPWINLVGWSATGLVLMSLLDVMAPRARLDRLPVRWLVGYYGAMLLMPLGMLAVADVWPPVVLTLIALGTLSLGSRAWRRWRANPSRPRLPASESAAG